MSDTIPYGRIITEQSYHDNKLHTEKKSYSVSVQVLDKSQALTEVMKALELITDKKTAHLVIEVEANKVTHHFKRVVKTYEITE